MRLQAYSMYCTAMYLYIVCLCTMHACIHANIMPVYASVFALYELKNIYVVLVCMTSVYYAVCTGMYVYVYYMQYVCVLLPVHASVRTCKCAYSSCTLIS